MTRFRRLVRDYERLVETLVGLLFVAFAMMLAHRFVTFMVQNAKQALGLRLLLEQEEWASVVGEAAGGEGLLTQVDTGQ